MRNSVKKAAVTALVCVTAAGMMAGCGNKKLDGTKIAVTVNKQEIPFGVVSLAARMQQAQAEAMYKMYLGGGSDMSIWSTKMDDDSDETYGENAVTTSVETVEKMCLEKEHASEYDVEITDTLSKEVKRYIDEGKTLPWVMGGFPSGYEPKAAADFQGYFSGEYTFDQMVDQLKADFVELKK